MHPGHRGTVQWRFASACCLLLVIFGTLQARKTVLIKRADFTVGGTCGDPAVKISAGPLINVTAPLLQYTITSFDPNWFNNNEAQQGTPLFKIFLSTALLPYVGKGVTMHVFISADTRINFYGKVPFLSKGIDRPIL